jgi:hypothetical protein
MKEVVEVYFQELPRDLPRRTEKNHETPQNNESAGRDLKLVPPEYEAEVLHQI